MFTPGLPPGPLEANPIALAFGIVVEPVVYGSCGDTGITACGPGESGSASPFFSSPRSAWWWVLSSTSWPICSFGA
jgi:hypothetical protein